MYAAHHWSYCETEHVCRYLETAPEKTLVSLLLLSSVVNVYMLGRAQGPVQSEVFSG